MIKSITIINTNGEKKTIDLGAPETSGLWIKSIKGIGPGKADINVTDLATSDGGIYNSARSEKRNITLSVGYVDYYTGEGETRKTHSVEDVRRDLYKWFSKKRKITFIVNLEQAIDAYTTRRINLGSVGYVESNEPDIFNKQEVSSVSIICPDPNMYLYDNNGNIISEAINFSATNDGFEFPMVFVVTSDRLFLPNKVYYELIDDEYVVTEDKRMISGKTYYEEIPIAIISRAFYDEEKCQEGYENNIEPEETEYFLTEDTEPKQGKEYFLKNGTDYYPVSDVYVPTTDESMEPTKTYYELVGSEYVVTEDESFDPEKTYYELVGITQLTTMPSDTYYEYRCKTELATLTTIAVEEKYYDGEIEIGLNFRIYIKGEVSGLSLYKIYDAYNYDSINIDDSAISLITGGGLTSGDEIRICTMTGSKTAVLIREATEYNIMNALGRNPAWLKLDQGINRFSYAATTGSENVTINIEYSKAYEGV